MKTGTCRAFINHPCGLRNGVHKNTLLCCNNCEDKCIEACRNINSICGCYIKDRKPAMMPKDEKKVVRKHVLQYDDNMNYVRTFKGLKDSAESIGVGTTAIFNALKTGRLLRGFYWRYDNESK